MLHIRQCGCTNAYLLLNQLLDLVDFLYGTFPIHEENLTSKLSPAGRSSLLIIGGLVDELAPVMTQFMEKSNIPRYGSGIISRKLQSSYHTGTDTDHTHISH